MPRGKSAAECAMEDDFVLLDEKELLGYNVNGLPPFDQADLEVLRNWLGQTNYDEPSDELSKNLNSYTPDTGKWVAESAASKQLFVLPNTGLLPKGITNMYSSLLGKYCTASGISQELQILILQVVIFTRDTPSLNMLASIVNVQRHGEKGLDMPLLDSKALIRKVCGPLLNIKDEVVHVVHHSFTEYLTNKDGARGSTGSFPVLTAADGHQALCDLCITFLNFDRFKQEGEDLRPASSGCMISDTARSTLARKEQYPFLSYAINNWGYHARSAQLDDVRIFEKMISHLKTEANVFTQLRGDGLAPYPSEFTPLHIAAAYGIKQFVLYLLERGADPEAADELKRTPLMNAAKCGSVDIVELLLSHGAQLNAEDFQQWTPLHFAAENGHAELARKLLDLGMPPNAQAVKFRQWGVGFPAPGWGRKVSGPPPHYTPLRLAIQKGHTEVAAELIPHLSTQDAVIQNSRKPKGKTILHYAASRDRAEIVSQILHARLVDVNQTDAAGRTPLLRAIQENGTLKTVQVLLQHGADPNLSSPLQVCAARKSWSLYDNQAEGDVIEIAAALVNAGVDINFRDKEGNTPVFYAAGGSGAILQWFVDNGADVTLRNTFGETPLHQAETEFNVECIIRQGADINAQDNRGNTPLHKRKRNAPSYEWIPILKLYMQHGANPYLENLEGVSAFHEPHLACMGGTGYKVADLLKIPGIDINAPDRFGRTLLHWLHETASDDAEIPPGINLDTQDWEGNTVLHLTAHAALFQSLLRAGANPHIRNRQGKLPFQMLLANKSFKFDTYGHFTDNNPRSNYMNAMMLKRILVPFVHMVDPQGNTALHIAVERDAFLGGSAGSLPGIVEVLLDELGVDVKARNAEGKTALHLAAVHGSGLPLLLQKYGLKSGVNDVDAHGRTPLHYAAASGCMCRSGVSTYHLLESGADAGKQDRYGRTPLHYAAQTGNSNAVHLLVQHMRHQSPLDVQDTEGRTPLHYAARTGHYATVNCLINAGARIDIKDTQGMSALHQAAAFGRPPTSRIEISKLPDKGPHWHFSPYTSVYCSGCGVQVRMPQYPRIRDVVRLLLSHGADADAVANNGFLPLHVAGECRTPQAIEVLYENWAMGIEPASGIKVTDIVTFAAEKTQPVGLDISEALASARFNLIETAAGAPGYSNTELTRKTAQVTSYREALWRALGDTDEVAVLQLLDKSTEDDFADIVVDSGSEDGGDRRRPVWDKQAEPFGRRVVGYSIQQGWISVFPAIIAKFGLVDHDIFALAEGIDSNLEMLQVLLSHIQNPNVKIKTREGPTSLWRKPEGDTILDIFVGSAYPWHSEAVRVLLAAEKVVPCLTMPADDGDSGSSKATLLHSVMGWPFRLQGAPRWVNETLQLLLKCEGVDINARCAKQGNMLDPIEESTPLMLALRYGHIDDTLMHIETLIKAGADVNLLDPVQASLENPAGLQFLLRAGGRLPNDHYRILHKLLQFPYPDNQKKVHCEVLEVLLATGLHANTLSESERANPLEMEIDDAVVTEIGAKNVGEAHTHFHPFSSTLRSPSLRSYLDQHHILHDIALHGSRPLVVEALLMCDSIEVDIRDASGRTPLLVACASPSDAIHRGTFLQPAHVAICLIEAGASPLAIDNAGYSALDYYLGTPKPMHWKRHWGLFEVLLQRGAATAPSSQNVLFEALKMKSGACYCNFGYSSPPCPRDYIRALHVLKLLEHGSDVGPQVRDLEGNNAMHLFLPTYLCLERRTTNRDEVRGLDLKEGPFPASMGDFNSEEILETLFHALVKHGNRNKADGNILLQANDAGESPLYAAVRVTNNFRSGILATIVEVAGGPEAVRNLAPTAKGRTLLHALGEVDLKGASGDWQNGHSREKIPAARIDAYEYLLDVVGIDREHRDSEGLTALELASVMGHDYVVEAVAMK